MYVPRPRPRRSVTVAASLAVLVAAGLSACSSSGSGATKTTSKGLTQVTIATSGATSSFGYLWVAQDAGFFAKNGLDVKLPNVTNAAQVPGIVSGSFQGTPLVGTAERAALQGQSVTNVMSVLTSAASGMVVRKGINTASDLRGKTIATASASSAPHQLLMAYLKKNNLTSSVKVLSLETISAQSTAFTSGQADGLFISFDSVVRASGQLPGSKVLVTPADLTDKPMAQGGLSLSTSFMKAHPATAKALIRSILEATKYTLDEPAKTQAIYAKEIELTQSEAAYVYDQLKAFIVLQPRPTDEMLTNNAAADTKSMGKTITLDDIKKVWDTTLTEQIFTELKCPDVCGQS